MATISGKSGGGNTVGKEVFSNHIGSASELTLLADIKPGFVPIPQPLTYAARLRGHLRMLSALRRNGLESDRAGVYVGPIDNLQTLQYVRWTLVENDTKMLLAVNFDRPFEPYVRRIVDKAGPLLDTILCHCVGFEGHSSDQGFDVFMQYAMRHQVPVELFAAAAPNLSVDDGDYYLNMDRDLRGDIPADEVNTHLAKLRIKTPKERLQASRDKAKLALLDQGLNILRVMYENAERFPNQNAETRDDLLYWNLTNRLVPGLLEALATPVGLPVIGPGWRERVLEVYYSGAVTPPPDASPQVMRVAERTGELLRDFRAPLMWFAQSVPPRNAQRVLRPPAQDVIQPGLLSQSVPDANITVPKPAFRATHACLLLMRIDDAARGAAFLGAMGDYIWPTEPTNRAVNLSITHSGLKTLNLPEHMRRRFPAAFREGMSARAGLLGDTDCNHPKEWSWPTRNWPLDARQTRIAPNSIDVIVQIEAAPENAAADPAFDADHPMYDQVDELAQIAQSYGVKLLYVEAMQRRYNGAAHVQGHLQFADGLSQPDLTPQDPAAPKMPWDTVKLGDLLVGHATQLGPEDSYPQFEAPLQNGTFQVVRKIKLDVAGFVSQAGKAHGAGVDAETVMAKMVGRQKDGSSFSTGQPDNAFDYADDADGTKTPLQSHVRRTNPREKGAPRILRRGFSYGPFAQDHTQDDGAERGLFFIAYNANIAEQFEVIQRWISGGNSTGISSWHGDPLLAPARPEGSRAFRFLHQGQSVTVPLDPKPMGVLEWGLYAFTPSRNGLMALAVGEYAAETGEALAQNAADTLAAEPDGIPRWKQFLEDSDDENRDTRDAFWQTVRNAPEPIDLDDFGVLVGKADTVRDILVNQDDAFSVQEYRDRMEGSIGVQYLGVDDRAQHGRENKILSAFLNTDLTQEKMFEDAYAVASSYLAAQPYETQSIETDGYEAEPQVKPLGVRLESKGFIHAVTAELSVRWFGIPADSFAIGGPQTDGPHCPRDFLASSYYLFTPHPTPFNKGNAEQRTPLAIAALRSFIESGDTPPADPNSLLGKLEAARQADAVGQKPEFWTSQKMAEYVAGSCFGLVGPVTGSFRSVFFDWIKEDKLWRLQQRLHEHATPEALESAVEILRPAILSSMSERPIADLLFRKTTKPVTIEGKQIDAGRKIIFSQRSAILDSDDAETFLFGGDYSNTDDAAMHKCPGKTMGLAILMGSFSAIMNAGNLAPEGPLSVRIKTQ